MSVEHEAGLNEDLKHCRLNLIPTRTHTILYSIKFYSH